VGREYELATTGSRVVIRCTEFGVGTLPLDLGAALHSTAARLDLLAAHHQAHIIQDAKSEHEAAT